MPKITIEFTGDDITLQVLDRIRALFTGAPVLPVQTEQPSTSSPTPTPTLAAGIMPATPQASASTAPSVATTAGPSTTTSVPAAVLSNAAPASDEATLRLQMTNAINEAQKRGGTIEGVKAIFTGVGGVNRGRDVPAALLPQVIAAINGINAK